MKFSTNLIAAAALFGFASQVFAQEEATPECENGDWEVDARDGIQGSIDDFCDNVITDMFKSRKRGGDIFKEYNVTRADDSMESVTIWSIMVDNSTECKDHLSSIVKVCADEESEGDISHFMGGWLTRGPETDPETFSMSISSER